MKRLTDFNESVNEGAGWVAIYNGKRIEIDKSEADGIYQAKQIAIKKLKVPKSKVGLLAIAPGHNESMHEAKSSNSFTYTDKDVADVSITKDKDGVYELTQSGRTIYLSKSILMQLSGL